jgi:hypothetical protein
MLLAETDRRGGGEYDSDANNAAEALMCVGQVYVGVKQQLGE